MSSRTQASERFRELIDQLAEEEGRAYGWQSSAARRLGIHRSTLKRILDQERRASSDSVERACMSLGLRQEFFRARAGHYREFLQPRKHVLGETPPPEVGLAPRVESDVRALMDIGRPMTVVQRAELARSLADAVLSWRIVREAQEIAAMDDEDAARAGAMLAMGLLAAFYDELAPRPPE